MQIITLFKTFDDLSHKAARLIINGETFLSTRMNEADSTAVEKEAVSAEIFGKDTVKRSFAVSRISDNGMREMFEVAS